jgi:uncharacterized OB-fold protein
MFCSRCGVLDIAPAKFCASCGSPMTAPSLVSLEAAVMDAVVSRWEAFLVAAVVGLVMFVLGWVSGGPLR